MASRKISDKTVIRKEALVETSITPSLGRIGVNMVAPSFSTDLGGIGGDGRRRPLLSCSRKPDMPQPDARQASPTVRPAARYLNPSPVVMLSDILPMMR